MDLPYRFFADNGTDGSSDDENKLRDRLLGNDRTRRSLALQAAISVVFGLAAFFAFCLLRARWTSLYAARRRRRREAEPLPVLPNSLFGWIPVVWRITEEEVLASCGLDAFVFLRFFKLAIKYTAFMLFFALSVIFPVIHVFESGDDGEKGGSGKKHRGSGEAELRVRDFELFQNGTGDNPARYPWDKYLDQANDYLWVYLVFVYLFSAVGVYLIVTETQKIIQVRQLYLAAKSSVSDRTIRLSGIPEELRSEDKIKETFESLEIGKVESVSLCRDWEELDQLLTERQRVLEQLEVVWTEYLGEKKASRKMKRHRTHVEDGLNSDEEQAALLSGDDMDDGAHVMAISRARPEKRLWFGFMNLQNRKVDAIDYYEEKLRRLDDRIRSARRKQFPAVPLAFVTLDSTAACQMACQAIIDPHPMQLVARPSPSPSGVVWSSTYLSRKTRLLRSWAITSFILVLTFLWTILLFPLAGITAKENIRAVTPAFAEWLDEHENFSAIFTTGVPTLLLAILNVAVPYLYEWLSYLQGMTSLGDIETSLISKNFFFTFFNLFVVFTLFGTGTTAATLFDRIDTHLRDLPKIAWTLAQGLTGMSNFYLNYVVLQTFGLFPFRLLQFGSIALYPWYRLRAKTPRDYSQLTQPGQFTYGFYIPQTLFIFLICIVYSVMKHTEKIQAFGLCYFLLGSFIYKYQLLYSMDHRQFGTGAAWPMMCVRFAVGLIVFQLVMAGQLAFKKALIRSALVAPLIIATVWFIVWYRRTFEPLMTSIALRALREVQDEAVERMAESIFSSDENGYGSGGQTPSANNATGGGGQRFRWPDLGASVSGIDSFPSAAAIAGAAAHQSRNSTDGFGFGGDGINNNAESSRGRSRYVNPSLVLKLEEPWIARTAEREAEVSGLGSTRDHADGGDARTGD